MIDLTSKQRMSNEQLRGIVNRYPMNGHAITLLDRAQAVVDIHQLLIEIERRRNEIVESTSAATRQHQADLRVIANLNGQLADREAVIHLFQEHLATYPSMVGEGRMFFWEKTARQLLGMPI